jgi:hypothetical protein
VFGDIRRELRLGGGIFPAIMYSDALILSLGFTGAEMLALNPDGVARDDVLCGGAIG